MSKRKRQCDTKQCSRVAVGYMNLRWHCNLHAPWKLLKDLKANAKRKADNQRVSK